MADKRRNSLGPLLPLLLLVSLYGCVSQAHKDVVIMHGFFAEASQFGFLIDLIEQYRPGSRVFPVGLFEGVASLTKLWGQVDVIGNIFYPILTNGSSDGVVLIGYSQGGIVSRGLLQSMKHNVETFIGLSCPLAGQYGDTKYLRDFFPLFVKHNAYKFFYTKLGQDTSIGNYWNDPHHQSLYRGESEYLAVLNNETTAGHRRSKEFRENFLRLKNLVLLGGPDDGVIMPWQSSLFGTYDVNETAQPMEKQKWYQNDAFGLRTMNEAGRVHLHTVANMSHHDWHQTKAIFDKYILPWL